MVVLLFGENNFLKRQRLNQLLSDFSVERYDGEELTSVQLRDLLISQTLFSVERTIVIFDLSLNSDAWGALPHLKIADGTTVVLYETRPDKRTKTYKFLAKTAKIEEFTPFCERNRQEAVRWCVDRAKDVYEFSLELTVAQTIVERLGMDMGRLDMMLAQLALVEQADKEFIDQFMPLAKSESVFELLDATMRGDVKTVHRIISYLEMTSGDDGAYQTMGLLASQVMNLSALVLSGGDARVVAKDLGAHPYSLGQLTPLARRLDKKSISQICSILLKADTHMKSTVVASWLLVEAALVEVAQVGK